jgi:hypothetical protein
MNSRKIVFIILALVVLVVAGIFYKLHTQDKTIVQNVPTPQVITTYKIDETYKGDQAIAENTTNNTLLPYTYEPWGITFSVPPLTKISLGNGSLGVSSKGLDPFAAGVLYFENAVPAGATDVKQFLLQNKSKDFPYVDPNAKLDTNTVIAGSSALHVTFTNPAQKVHPGVIDDYYFIHNNHLFWIQSNEVDTSTPPSSLYAPFLAGISFQK